MSKATDHQPSENPGLAKAPADIHLSFAARPLRVLLVDDHVDTVVSLSMLLQVCGHDVRSAHDGPAGLQAAIDYRPDVVVLDIGLPGLNGYEVAKRIRLEPDLRNVVLIALTGYGQDSDRQASKQAGFNHHLVKPTILDQLEHILATVSVSGMATTTGDMPSRQTKQLAASAP